MKEGMLWWVPIEQIDPPHSVSRPEQVIKLANELNNQYWPLNKPVLIGYLLDNRIQLLSGSHRFAASLLVDRKHLPVRIYSYKYIESIFTNLDQWKVLMTDKNLSEWISK